MDLTVSSLHVTPWCLRMETILIFLSMILLIISSLSNTRSYMLEVVDKTQSYKSVIKGERGIRTYFDQRFTITYNLSLDLSSSASKLRISLRVLWEDRRSYPVVIFLRTEENPDKSYNRIFHCLSTEH